jgi:hypothetical protein
MGNNKKQQDNKIKMDWLPNYTPEDKLLASDWAVPSQGIRIPVQ